ncbi:non-specific lipid transfer protein GPI-anchored 2-like protein [Carex littledalei]|uniref:Non-specific lipid transfer protein GPI-anchored 2-like protein n=1 Tax=Carex littledalei TaxID=544730 RepID=A0A833VGE4_9POAL|nr:non-specific lipid transfer protein GPI-anchored 2-like protein [Carex littledalei]
MIAMAMLSSHVSAQTSGCMISIISLSSCMNYITGNSSIPSSSCCSSLSSVIKNEPQCFSESTTTGESSDAMSNKSHVISIVFLVVSALASALASMI